MKRYLVLNDTMSAILKSNKCKTYQQKIINPLINEKHVLVDSYFYTHISRLLNFNMDDVVSFFFYVNYDNFIKKKKTLHQKLLTAPQKEDKFLTN